MKRLLRVLGICLLVLPAFGTSPAHAWEPYSTDINQPVAHMSEGRAKFAEAMDHLEPAKLPTNDHDYVVYFALISDNRSFFYITGWSHAFSLYKWDEHGTSDRKINVVFCAIPEDITKQLYDLWINALLEARYDRRTNSGDDGTTYFFSAPIPGKELVLKGKVWSPTGELPPGWMAEAAEAVLQYAKDQDAAKCRETLAALHDKLFAYWKKNGRH